MINAARADLPDAAPSSIDGPGEPGTAQAALEAPDTSDPTSPAWRRPPATPEELRLDALAAIGLFLLGVLSLVLGRAYGLFAEESVSMGMGVALMAVQTLPLALRRRYPTPTALVVAVAFIVGGELGAADAIITSVALFMAIYSVGAWEHSRRVALWVRSAIVVAMAVWLLTGFFRAVTSDVGSDLPGQGYGALTPVAAYLMQQLLLNALFFAGAWWFGEHARRSARQRTTIEQQAARLAAEQTRLARQAVTIERLRIARELHDAVAHHVSLMGVQAAAARAVLPRDVEASAAQLRAIEDSARAAVDELYQLLGTLRDDDEDDGAASLASLTASFRSDQASATLGLGDLPALVTEAQAAGIRATFDVVGAPVPVPGLVGLNLYRIAQESLTNVVKHAGPGASTQVRLRYEAGAVELEVTDDGRGRRRAGAPGLGLGLVGMRERSSSLRATLHAAPREGGGWIVRVTAPLASGRAMQPATASHPTTEQPPSPDQGER